MGMNIPQKKVGGAPGPEIGNSAEKIKKMNSDDNSGKKSIRYTKDQILEIYKGLGQFRSPLNDCEHFKIAGPNSHYLSLILNKNPNVVLQNLKDLAPAAVDKKTLISSMIDKDLNKLKK